MRRTDVNVEQQAPERAPVGDLTRRARRRARRSRVQIVMGCIGLVLVALGVLFATVSARRELVPPLELSIVHDPAGQSVATVEWGSTAPLIAQFQIVAAGRVLWSSALSPNAAPQYFILPSSLLGPTSHVVVVSQGTTLREVGG